MTDHLLDIRVERKTFAATTVLQNIHLQLQVHVVEDGGRGKGFALDMDVQQVFGHGSISRALAVERVAPLPACARFPRQHRNQTLSTLIQARPAVTCGLTMDFRAKDFCHSNC